MKTLTINWVGEVKVMETKFGPKNKFSIKAPEEGDKFIEVWLKTNLPIWKVGEIHEVEEITEREYNGKKYYSAKLPNKFGARNDEAVLKAISDVASTITKQNLLLVEIGRALNVESLRSKVAGTEIDYPEFKGQPDFVPEDDGLDQLNEDEYNSMGSN